ncbi:MAG: hypothetical protein ABSA45_08710 [Verrucomicrobiota bacterium]|jgi:hypothetical protein
MKANPQTGSKFPCRIRLWLCLAALPLLASCAGTTMHGHFRDYNAAYADALNEQMALNLARLENGHPAYYLAIGAIDDRLTVSGSATLGNTGAFTDSKNTVSPAGTVARLYQSVFGYSAGGTATRSSSPEFQFIPLNNEAVAKQVLQPISTEVFLQLYQQGYPIDQLLRIMIERIETPTLQSGEQLVLVNSPASGSPEYYERFLRACAILRTLQMHGYLSLQARPELDPLGPVSFSSGQPGRGGQPQGAGAAGSDSLAREGGANPTLKDFTDAEDKNLLLTNRNSGWSIYRKRAVPKFVLRYEPTEMAANGSSREGFHSQSRGGEMSPEMADFVNKVIAFLKADPNYNHPNDYNAITNVVGALASGISIQTDIGNNDQTTTRLVLRSFNRTMESVACEQAGFEALGKSDANFATVIPDFERRPILQMMWTNKPASLAPPLETVHYAGKTYQITDPAMDPLNPAASWNRDVFRLLVDLSSQVTVDISKFQRQVLQLQQ